MVRSLILLVEGRYAGVSSFSSAMEKAGYTVVTVHTGREALLLLDSITPDIIVFDGLSMRSNGARTCQRIRKQLTDIPLIHCRLQTAPPALSAEADICLQAPFTPRKLLNRVRMLLPAQDKESQIVRIGGLILYQGKRAVHVEGKGEFQLTPKLTKLLYEFLSRPNETISRLHLMKTVWKTDYVGDTRTLDVHIRWIREIIEETPSKPTSLITVRGKGYRYIPKTL